MPAVVVVTAVADFLFGEGFIRPAALAIDCVLTGLPLPAAVLELELICPGSFFAETTFLVIGGFSSK